MKRFLKIVRLVPKQFILLFFILPVLNGMSQSPGIQKRIYLPQSQNAYSRDIVETTPGNFVLIGQSFDSIGSQVENRLTLAGTDNSGNLNWRKSYGGNKFTYTALIGSSRYILKHKGFLYAAMPAIDSTGREPGVLIKFNFNGDTLWQKKYYQSNITAHSLFTSVCPSIDNGFLITGAIQTNTPGFNNHPIVGLYVLKTDVNGNKLWDKIIYKNDLDQTQVGNDIVQDSLSKRIIIVGNQDSNSGGSANVLILDSLGNTLIQKGSGPDFFGNGLMNIIKTRDGNFISSGIVSYPFVNSNPTSRSFLVKFDTNAAIIFGHEYDTICIDNGISRIAEMEDGQIITGGYFESANKYTNGLNHLSRIIKHDKHGNLLWKKYFDNYTDNHNQDLLLGMYLTGNHEIVFTSFCECAEPAPLQFMFYLTDTNYCDANAVSCYSVTTGLREEVNKNPVNKLILYPNPATNECTLKTDLSYQYGFTQIIVKNVLAEEIFKENGVHATHYTLNTMDYPAGIYFICVFKDKQLISEHKLIVIK